MECPLSRISCRNKYMSAIQLVDKSLFDPTSHTGFVCKEDGCLCIVYIKSCDYQDPISINMDQ